MIDKTLLKIGVSLATPTKAKKHFIHWRAVILTFAAVLCFSALGLAQSISGVVTGSEGEGLIGATVLVTETGKGTATDINGAFTLQGVEEGAMLLISYTGYSPMTVAAKDGMEVILQVGETLDEVVVTGVFDARTRMESSIAITTISTEQLDRVAATSASDLLKNIPGVFVNQARGEIWNSVYSRGLSAKLY